MDSEIDEILEVERKAKSIIDDARAKSLKIRSKDDIEISNRTKSIKDEINSYLKTESKNAKIESSKEHQLKIEEVESTILFDTVPKKIKDKLINDIISIILDTTFKMVER
ncbi:MAG: hypothetical protein OCD02_16470 [Spirochaetaceae bacterium]